MKTIGIITAATMLVIALTSPSALACEGVEEPIAISAGSETVYIDDRSGDANDVPGTGFVFGPGGTWIYLESNSVSGLQRGGDTGVPGGADPCVDSTDPDQIIF